ncbi:sensor histidine kinase [Jejuia spongiicola]|uniref:histidine kinase n=1 Tax=Jejuia spongiicola TaxID=2942207 RepID=A0ABT0QDF1_9FLAO|nr:sensor histidine kinase [Jejuia spongiicola]MCL6294518.1 sensor histidine kinase [Jejuia spongiicola]
MNKIAHLSILFITSMYLLIPTLTYSQEALTNQVKELKIKISELEGGSKLKLMDSLSRLINYTNNPKLKADSIIRATIEYAYKMDSLEIAVARTSSLIFYYANRVNKPKEGINVFNDFKKKKLNISDNDILARLYTNAGDAYFFSGTIKESIPIYDEAEAYALKDNDSILYAEARTYKASAFVDMGDYATGSQLLSETAKIFTILKDTTRLIGARNTLAVVYSKMGFYEEAKKERTEVIQISKSQRDYRALIPNLFNAAIDANKNGDQVLRLKYLNESYYYNTPDESTTPRTKLSSIISYALLSAYSENDSLVKAQQFFNKIQNKFSNNKPVPFEYAYRSSLADYFIAVGNYKNALTNAQMALDIHLSTNNTEGIYESYDKLTEIYSGLNDFEKAFTYTSKYNRFKDSINSIQKSRALSYYQTLYETEKRDFKIADQASQIALLDAENKINRQWMLFGGAGLLLGFLIIYLIRSRRFIASKQELQEKFSQDLLNEQEKERSRLARDLHDSVGQKLMLLSKTTQKLGDENAEKLATNTLEEVRSISRGLHPSNLERLGLTEAINALIYDINANTDLFFTDEIDNIDNALSKESELHLYRIIQETLNNIIKHSEAKAVKMKIQKTANDIQVMISDNGKGFDLESKYKNMSLGLKTLFERAKILGAKMNLDSVVNQGTKVTLTITH